MRFATIAVPAAAAAFVVIAPGVAMAAGTVSVTPSKGVTDGQTVSVHGTGVAPGANVFFFECDSQTDTAKCATDRGGQGTASASGAFTSTIKLTEGKQGDTGMCNAGDTCYIVAATVDKKYFTSTSFTFAGGATATTPAATASATPSSTASAATSSAPDDPSTDPTDTGAATTVNAGSGGDADRNGTSPAVLALALVGGATALAGGTRLARRR